MGDRRVVITGMGWVTPLGRGVDEVWSALLAGRSGIAPVSRFAGETFPTNFAAEVKDFELPDRLGDSATNRRQYDAGLHTRFALAAAQDAWDQSGLGDDRQLDRRRLGIYLGAGEGPVEFDAFSRANLAGWDAQTRSIDAVAWAERAYELMDPQVENGQEPYAPVSHLAQAFGCGGPAFNCMTACAASTQAVGEAVAIVRRGDADAMFAGGTHSMIHALGMTGFIRLTAMSKRRDEPATASRPFDRTRDGFVMGEGAGMLVVEELGHAQRRGAEILCELVGFGSTADAFRITDIQPTGVGGQGAMRMALRQAGIDPRAVDAQGRAPVQYISAHGTGTSENDGIETRAVKGVFGDLAPRVAFSSVKSMLGHMIQAAGAVELMTCVQAIRTGWIPPTMNLHEPDPECDLDHVPNEARDLTDAGGVEVALSNGFGFGGQNDTVCVRRFG